MPVARVLVAVLLLAPWLAAGCGGSGGSSQGAPGADDSAGDEEGDEEGDEGPDYADDLYRICHAERLSEPPPSAEADERYAHLADWLARTIRHPEAIFLIDRLAVRDAEKRRILLDEEAEDAGLEQCPLAQFLFERGQRARDEAADGGSDPAAPDAGVGGGGVTDGGSSAGDANVATPDGGTRP